MVALAVPLLRAVAHAPPVLVFFPRELLAFMKHAITPALRSLSLQPPKSSSSLPSQPGGGSSPTLRFIGSHGFDFGLGFGSW